MSCEDKPYFVIVKKTGTGFSFDNTVTYKSPLATHTLSQAKGVLHPSLQVESDWGIKNKSGTITQLVTGQAGANALRTSSESRNIILKKDRINKKTGKKIGLISRFGLLAPTKNKNGYTLTRVGDRAEGLSVAELALLLSDISKRPSDIKVRGSPLEYKRLLDYIQFLMVEKVTNRDDLYLARPNNYRVMEAVQNDGISLEDAYEGMNDTNSTMYGKAYFVTMDRLAALASVVRQIPTIYQRGASKSNPKMSQLYYKLSPIANVNLKIREQLTTMLKLRKYNMPKTSMNIHTNRIQELTTPTGRPVITSGPLFAWFLNTRDVSEKTNAKGDRVIGTDFHGLGDMDKALILFYWAFHYPDENGGKGVNEQVIKYFLAILDTFHDFTDKERTANFRNLWPESANTTPHLNAKNKTRNGISNQNIPSSSKQHKFLVKLLGIDIYRKVGAYNNSITKTLSITNTRKVGDIPNQMKVAHFLYFITNVLGSQSSRGIISACENLSREIMVKLANDTPINGRYNVAKNGFGGGSKNMCKFLKEEKACVVIDAVSGGVPPCVKEYSVFHNVGLLDPADKGVLSWGEVVGDDGCIESAKTKALKKKKKKQLEAVKRASQSRVERAAKAKATRAQGIENEAVAKKRKANLEAIKTKQALNRRSALALKRGITVNNKPNNTNKPNNSVLNANTKAKFNALGNMKMNISKGAPPRPNMQSFKLYLNAGNVTNETVKNLLNRITYNKSNYIGTNKQTIRNVLNKVIRLNKNDNLNRKARSLKSTMFANNTRQLRARPQPK